MLIMQNIHRTTGLNVSDLLRKSRDKIAQIQCKFNDQSIDFTNKLYIKTLVITMQCQAAV